MEQPFPFRIAYFSTTLAKSTYENALKLPEGYEKIPSLHAIPLDFPKTIDTHAFQLIGHPHTGVSFEGHAPDLSALGKPLGFYADQNTGKKFVLKQARNLANKEFDPQFPMRTGGNPRPGEATRHEALAMRLYRFFGIPSPASQLYDGFTGELAREKHNFGDNIDPADPNVVAHSPYLVSEHLGPHSLSLAQFYSDYVHHHPDHVDARNQFEKAKILISRGIIMDALLGHYDLHSDNVGFDGKETTWADSMTPWRWDAGGSLGFGPFGQKKQWSHWGKPTRHYDILPDLITIIQQDMKRFNEAPNGALQMYAHAYQTLDGFQSMLDESKRIVRHAIRNRNIIRDMFQSIPNGDEHFNVFMDRVQCLKNMVKSHKNADDLAKSILAIVGPHPNDLDHLLGPKFINYIPPDDKPIRWWQWIRRRFSSLFDKTNEHEKYW